MKSLLLVPALLVLATSAAFSATLTFGSSAPTPAGSAAISNWRGATFDAANVGGSGVNADGGANNGAANDATTYVSNNRSAQGETFTTGSNAGGYTITAITVRAAGYTNNTASGSNVTSWSLANTTRTFYVRVGQLSGTTFIPNTIEYAASGGTGNPGSSSSVNGSGTYLTFTLKAPIVLLPNTVYAFDIGTTGDSFEMLGISTVAAGGTNPYTGGTAYTSGANGAGASTITSQAGSRVFMVDMAPYTAPAPGTFVHPGLLNTAADFVRMRTNVALGVEPWLSNYNALKSSWMANTGWPSHAQATITRGSINDSSRLYNDIAVAYSCALVWKISGDTAYADEAVRILNAWAYTFTGLAGDTNIALNELYGCQFAATAEIMRTYPGWAPADFAQFQTMIYNVFYPVADSFLTSHFGTGDSHYWANWDLASMSTLYAIGVLNDNPTLTTRSTNYFYGGVGNGCIDRAVNFIHPGYLGQGQEMGRDQGHATLDIAQLAAYCQMAWNQGTDLFGYENNRVLSMAEYTAKYNLGNDVPWTNYGYDVYWPTVWLQTGVSSGSRGDNQRPGWPTLYNHYVNVMGLSAPYTKQMADNMGTNWGFNGDSLGWDQLTTALPPIASGANPSSLSAVLHGQQPCLSWWGNAYATSYKVKRSTTPGGPYTTIATGVATNTYTDTNPVAGVTNYYVVTGSLSGGGETGVSNETAVILGVPLLAQLNLDETSGTTAADSAGNGWNGTLVNGATWTAGKNGNAVNLSKASSQYVSLPAGIVADVSDLTISAWVYQTSASNYAQIFSFGSGDNFYGGWSPWNFPTWLPERYMYLMSQDGNGKVRFGISRSTSVGEETISGASALPAGQWAHVIVTLNAGVGTLYVNGLAVGQNLNMPMTPMQFPPTTQNYIGRSQSRNDPYFDGKIDDFRIYRGALTTGQAYTLATGLAPATPPATAPANLAVTALAGNQNSLSWTATAGAASYTVLRATSSGGPYSIIATIVPGTTYVDQGVTAGTTYYYEVDGANSGGDGAVSSPSSGVVALPPIPSVPAGLTAVSGSTTTAVLNWTAAANAYSYNVKRSLTSGGPYTTIASGLTATTYTDTGLTAGTTYYYVISSVNTAGESANSTEDNATPSDLLVHLRFDETSGATSADASGNGWNATLVNAPTWTPGIFGNAINLSSASTQYATLGTGVVSTVNNFTITVWVKMTSFATWARVFDFGTGTTNYMFLTAQGAAGTGKPRFAIRTPTVAEQHLDSSVALQLGVWTQIVVTLNGTTAQMYINGALVGTNSAMTLTPASLGSTTQNYLGRSEFSADPYLNGSIDDLRINGHTFTAAQVAANASPSPVPPTGLGSNSGDGLMTLNWAVDETATTYNVKRATVSGGPYTTVGTGLTTPTFLDTSLTNGTTYFYVVSAVNWLGESANSTETSGIAYSLAWAAQDIGTVGATGSSSVSGGTVTVNGSGADIWGTADAFQFRSVPITGNCIMTARVLSVTNTNVWSKAGVMIRDTLAANAIDAAMLVTPTTAQGIQWQSRNTTGGNYTNTEVYGITAPYWVRLVRTGTTIQGYRSSNGVNWTSQGSATLASLGSTAYVGLAVTSHLDGTLCTATFDNVSINWIPDSPTDLNATPGVQQISLSWDSMPNATSYNVSVASVSGGPYTLLATGLAVPFYTQTGLTSGTPSYYVISATSAAGTGANSAEVSALPIPVAPTGLAAVAGFAQVSLSWNSTGFATSYNVKRATTSGGPYTTLASPSGTNYTDSSVTNGTTYFYVITAVDNSGESSASSEANATPPPPGAVTGVVATVNNNLVSLTWNAAPGATSYEIGRSTTNGGPYTIISSGVTGTSYNDASVNNGTPYYYVVISSNSGGVGANSQVYGTTPMAPPAIPTGLAAAPGDAQATLTWMAVPGAASYVIGRATVSGGSYTTVGTPAVTSYTDTGLTNGTTYYYVVAAVNAAGQSTNSTEANVQPSNAPMNLAATAGNAQVALTWTASLGSPLSYNIYRSTSGTGGFAPIAAGLATTSYTDATAANGTTYYYDVTGVYSYGEGTASVQASSRPMPPLPVAPTALAAVGASGQISLNWASVTYAASYNVKRATTSGGPYTTVGNPTANSFTDTGLAKGTTYYYVVTAVNISGEGAASLEASAPTIPGAVANLTVAAGNNQVALNWNATAGATTYSVGRSTTSGGPYSIIGSGGVTTGYIDSSATNGTTYYYVVAAADLAGTGPNSSEVNAKPLPALPTAPTGFAAVAGNAQVSLNWNATTYATSYTIGRATTSGGPYTNLVSGVTETTCTDASAVNGTTYYYVISAVDLAGTGPKSSEVNAKPLPPLPAAPTGFAAVAGNAQVSLNWNATTYATSYTIGRSATSGGPYTVLTSGVTGTSYVDGSASNGTTYYYVVAAGDLAGTGPNSSEANAKPMSPLPAVPKGLAATAYNAEIDLTWNASAGAMSYNVLRSTTSGSGYATIATGLTATSYVDTGLTNATPYYYVVTATNAFGTSGNSNQASATPVATPIVDSWYDNDIGNVAQSGSSGYSAGTFTLNGSGNGIAGVADSADYTYQTLVGDGTIIARVATRTAGESGVMIRETLAANAREVDMLLQLNVGAVFQYRTTTGATVITGASVGSTTVPYWVKLARAGNVFTGYTSPDGVTWTQVGTITNTMASSVYIGLTQSSVTNTSLSTGTFTNVSIVPTSAFASQDIGAVAGVGATYYSNGVATINASGTGITGKADQFRYTYKLVSGNCSITARVTALTNTNANAKAGVMIRETLATGAKDATVVVTPSNGVAFNYRTTTNGSTTNTTASGLKAPYWVRVVRSGNTFTASRSANGTTWTTIKSLTITMATNVYIGLPVCATTTSSTALCTATIDNITTSP